MNSDMHMKVVVVETYTLCEQSVVNERGAAAPSGSSLEQHMLVAYGMIGQRGPAVLHRELYPMPYNGLCGKGI